MQSHNIARIPLRAHDGSVRAYAIVDAADADWVNQWRWHLMTDGSAARNYWDSSGSHYVSLHRELLGLSSGDGLEGDHVDHDRLNNQRSNLRVVTHAQNTQNVPSHSGSSKYRGVTWHARIKKWQAQFRVDHKYHYIGVFDDEDEAGRAASEARKQMMTHAVETDTR